MNPLPPCSFGPSLRLLAAAALTLPGAAPAQAPAPAPVGVERAVETVARWTPDQHLYVKGDLGLPPEKLAGLEAWLDANAPHWTVVLARDAAGESFRDDDGRVHAGMDAVDHALGKTLANTTAFGDLTDARTGERNGAFFILYLKERKFTYYASDAHDRRQLGESRWIGKLDQPAIRAMRGGGRIVDAVKDTIANIESQLTRQIEAERTAARLAAARRQEALAENRASLQALGAELDALDKAVATYRSGNPEASGDLVQPPTAAWRAALAEAGHLTGEGQIDGPARTIRTTREAVAAFRENFERLAKAPAEADRLEERLAGLGSLPEAAAAEGLRAEAREALASARDNAARADSLYLTQLASGHAAVDAAERAILSWRRAAEAERARKRLMAWFLWSGLAAAAIATAAGLAVANRLRRPAKAEAEQALARWRDQLGGRFDTLFQLMDRAGLAIGTGSQLNARGYTDATLRLGRETVRLVDELFIMSSAADKVMGLAAAAIEPRGLTGRLVNAVSSSRYRRGLRLLESEAIGFDRKEGWEAILRTGADGTPRLLGEASDYEPFRLTFAELVSAYDAKQAAATASLDRLQGCLDGLPVRLEAVRTRLVDLRVRAEALDREAGADGHFPLGARLGALADAVATALDEAAARGRTDPVSAHEGPAAEADRLATEGLRLADRIASWRAAGKPAVDEAIGVLHRHRRRTAWIVDAHAELAALAAKAADAILAGPAGAALDAFEAGLDATGRRLADIVALSRRAVDASGPAIDAAETAIATARASLAASLACDPAALFEEADHRPGDFLAEARRDLDAALTAVDRGQPGEARARLDEIDGGLATVGAIRERSAAIFAAFAGRETESSRQAATVEAGLSGAGARVESLRRGYDSAVLRFDSRFPDPDEADPENAVSGDPAADREGDREDDRGRSLDGALAAARRFLADGQADLAAARAARVALRPLEAEESLDQAGASFSDAADIVADIDAHADALAEAEAANPEAWRAAAGRHRDQGDDMADDRTRRRTIDDWEAAGRELSSLSAAMERDHPDPFAVRAALEALDRRLGALAEAVVADWDRHALASATLSAAAQQVGKLESRVGQSQSDSIPDSAGVLAAATAGAECRRRLADLASLRSQPHGDWEALEREAAAIASDALVLLAGLDRELERGKACAAALNRAAESVREVKEWRSRHRVSLDREAGLAAYRLAYDAFSAGDYDAASRHAAQARQDADRAIQQAAFEERRARDRAQEAARAASRPRRSSGLSSGGGSSFGSRSSSGGRSSFGGGGSSRSGFSSRSGTSRSGW